jgi:CRP/FNR family transcriptional regulator
MLPNPVQSQVIEALFTDPTAGARRVLLRAGEMLFATETHHSEAMFIHSGEIRMFQVGPNGSERLGAIFGPGDWIGAAAVSGVAFAARALAPVASEVSIMPVANLMDLLPHRPEAAVVLFKQTAERLMHAYSTAAGLTFDDCNERLIKTLISLSDSPSALHEGDTVTVRITHQQLAQAVGAARETISLALTELRHKHLLATGRNRLIFNPLELAAFRCEPKPRKRSHAPGRESVSLS